MIKLRWVAMFAALTIPSAIGATQFGVVTKFRQGLTGFRMIDLIRAAGVSINRDVVAWRDVEPVRGRLEWSRTNAAVFAALDGAGIRSDVILVAGNPLYDGGKFPTSPAAIAGFARFAGYVARQIGGHTVAFEISNEWHTSPGIHGPTTPTDYVNLFVAAANAIHAVDPAARVVADPAIFAYIPAGPIPAPTTPVGADMRRALKVADGVVVHQYPYQQNTADFAQSQDKMVQAMTRRHEWLTAIAGRPIPLYVTEYGWPQIPEIGLTPAAQGAQLGETTRLLGAMRFVNLAIVYELADSCADQSQIECTFGLYARGPQLDWIAKPALASFSRAVGDSGSALSRPVVRYRQVARRGATRR